MDEDARVERLIEAARDAGAALAGGAVRVGPGDDAAVLTPPAGRDVVWTTDELLEGVHFRRSWASWREVGRKAVGAALSDLAAMGADPLGALISLGLPSDLAPAEGEAIMAGAGAKLGELGCPLVGGNVSLGAPVLSVAVSAMGTVSAGAALRRSGGEPGDVLFVSGPLGWSRLGLLWLESGGARDDPRLERAIRAQLDPQPRFDLARALAGKRLACMDLSDGLAADLPRLAKASGQTFEVERALIPAPDADVCAIIGKSPQDLAWIGGEDYELLVAGPAELEALGLTRISR